MEEHRLVIVVDDFDAWADHHEVRNDILRWWRWWLRDKPDINLSNRRDWAGDADANRDADDWGWWWFGHDNACLDAAAGVAASTSK
jgi:hypothetical protein